MRSFLNRAVMALTAGIVMILPLGGAGAVPLTWHLHATFQDGATATGSFVFDADIVPDNGTGVSQYSDINVTISGGSVFPTITYDDFIAHNVGNDSLFYFVQDRNPAVGDPQFSGRIFGGLSNLGGTRFLDVRSRQSTCMAGSLGDCDSLGTPQNFTAGDGVVTTEVPAPASVALLLTGLAGLGAARRRRR